MDAWVVSGLLRCPDHPSEADVRSQIFMISFNCGDVCVWGNPGGADSQRRLHSAVAWLPQRQLA